MRIFFTLFSLFILAMQLRGQSQTNIQSDYSSFKKSHAIFDEKQITGSPYLTKRFTPATILRTDGTEIKDFKLRYNIYKNTMEFEKNGEVLAIANPATVQKIFMDGKIFTYSNYAISKNVNSSYFEVLYEGSYQLLKKYEVTINEPTEKAYSLDSVRFVRKSPQFYLRSSDGMAHLFYSQKSLIKVLQPISQNVIDQIHVHKINAKDEKQLIELMHYIDQKN